MHPTSIKGGEWRASLCILRDALCANGVTVNTLRLRAKLRECLPPPHPPRGQLTPGAPMGGVVDERTWQLIRRERECRIMINIGTSPPGTIGQVLVISPSRCVLSSCEIWRGYKQCTDINCNSTFPCLRPISTIITRSGTQHPEPRT